MTRTKNRYSQFKAVKQGRATIYLSNRDIEKGEDIRLDLLGYEIIAL